MSSSHPTGGKPDSAPDYKRPIPGMGVGERECGNTDSLSPGKASY